MSKEKKEKSNIPDIEKIFLMFESEFKNTFFKEEEELLEKIDSIINMLDLGQNLDNPNGFNAWPADRLISAREKLARYSEPLGEYISVHESRSDFAYIWRKGAYAKDWLPAKTELMNNLSKVTNVEVDNKLTEKYLNEQYYSMFHRRRADFLIRKLEGIDRIIRTIDHRLRELYRQLNLPQEANIK